MNKLVPTLETCKKLKEAGWENETYFGWSGKLIFSGLTWHRDVSKFEGSYPAPTLTELLEELPARVGVSKELEMDKSRDGEYRFDYFTYELKSVDFNTNPAEAAALLWLELKENNLIK